MASSIPAVHHHHHVRPPSRWPSVLLTLLLVAVALAQVALLGGRWQHIRGHEPEWIARSLAEGHGYSFPHATRWLFEPGPADRYAPTAWAEPIYTGFLAACFRWLGDYARLGIFAVQVALVLGTCIVLYRLGTRLMNNWAGLVAAGLLVLMPYTHFIAAREISSAPLGGFLVALIALALVRCMDVPTWRRGVALGLALGLGALSVATTLLFIPVAAVLVLVRRAPGGGRGWAPAVLAVVIAGAVIAPWTVRNYRVFGEVVPVRNGAGQMLHLGNVVLGAFSNADLLEPGAPPPVWTTRSAAEAVWRVREDTDVADDFYNFALVSVARAAPPGYEAFNEAQRDAVYRDQARRFILAHPVEAVSMTVRKAMGFLFAYWVPVGVLLIVALAGVVQTLRDGRVWALWLLVAVYALPYAVTLPFYYRYRYPMEPLVAALAALTVMQVVAVVRRPRAAQPAVQAPSPQPVALSA